MNFTDIVVLIMVNVISYFIYKWIDKHFFE